MTDDPTAVGARDSAEAFSDPSDDQAAEPGPKRPERIRVRLFFAQKGEFCVDVVSLPAAGLADHERLIDFIREDRELARECYINAGRLCSAQIVDEDEGEREESEVAATAPQTPRPLR